MTEIKTKTPQGQKRTKDVKTPKSAPPQKKLKSDTGNIAETSMGTPKRKFEKSPGKGTPGKKFQKNTPKPEKMNTPKVDGKGDAKQTPAGDNPNRKRKGGPPRKGGPGDGPSPNKQQKQQQNGDGEEKKRKKRGGARRNKGITDNLPTKNLPNLTDLQQKATDAQRLAQKELDKADMCKLFVKNFPKAYKESDLKALSKDITSVDIHQNRKSNFRFGYMYFSSEKVAEKTHKALQGKELDGAKLTVDFCGSKAKKGASSIKEGKLIDPFKLYISHITQSTTIEELREMFPDCVEIWTRISDNSKHAMVFFDKVDKAMKKLGAVGKYLAFYGSITLNKDGLPLTRDAEREFVSKKKLGYKMERFDEPGNDVEEDDSEDDDDEESDEEEEEEEETVTKVAKKDNKKVVKQEEEDEEDDDDDDEEEDDDDDDDDEEDDDDDDEDDEKTTVAKKTQKKAGKQALVEVDDDDDEDDDDDDEDDDDDDDDSDDDE